MIIKKFLALLTLSALLVGWTPIAYAGELEDEHFSEIKAGELAAEDGYFFTEAAVARMIAKQETKLKEITIIKDTEIKKLELNLETVNKKKEIELSISKELYESLLKIRQERIDQLVKEQRANDWKLAGGFMAGVVISITIFYAAVQVSK